MGDGKTRKINFIIEDDAYQPDKAVANAKKLIEDERVFMLFNTLGTPNNTAIMPLANAQKVPQTFVASGAGVWGKDLKTNSWTSGWQIAYPTEAAIYAQYLKDTKPNAKVAVLSRTTTTARTTWAPSSRPSKAPRSRWWPSRGSSRPTPPSINR